MGRGHRSRVRSLIGSETPPVKSAAGRENAIRLTVVVVERPARLPFGQPDVVVDMAAAPRVSETGLARDPTLRQ